ncbi:hypothetical protein OAD67_00035 [bacterium]|jgi:hypothetical protein|nr:hypothetical protein [bacterium]|tara:strand:- start:16357 stop:16599 length:243 start_codon:yes stop_codon:yes gene_type:complete
MASAEPSLQDFMKNPQVKYLKENPKAIAAVCGILVFVGIPGAASVSALVSLLGPIEMLLPMVMMMAGPVAEMMAGAATAV